MSDETSSLKPKLTFEQVLANKLEDNFADLFSAEEFRELITKAVQQVFFEPVAIHTSYGSPSQRPPYFVQKVGELAKPMIDEAVKEWFEANPDFVKEHIKKILEEGVIKAGIDALDNRFRYMLQPFIDKLSRPF